MKLAEFDYPYPEDLVAQHPLPCREDARMMVVPRNGGDATHHHVTDLPDFLRAGDVLVINTTQVIPARLIGQKESGGAIEVLLLQPMSLRSPEGRSNPGRATEIATARNAGLAMTNTWWCLTSHTKRLKPGMRLTFPSPLAGEGQGEGVIQLAGTIKERSGDEVLIEFYFGSNFLSTLKKIGLPPLPPYIVRKKFSDYSTEDRERYQTVFAQTPGAAAAPTAGLHLSDPLLKSLREKGIEVAELVLHVGRDTFQPVRVENIADHPMHGEELSISENTADMINRAKTEGRRIIAVGTTSVRALESAWDLDQGKLIASSKTTHIFITPGYIFRVIDGLMTNFHQPKSTLIMLVSALLGRERVLALYAEAIRERYRLFSFGDCMLVV